MASFWGVRRPEHLTSTERGSRLCAGQRIHFTREASSAKRGSWPADTPEGLVKRDSVSLSLSLSVSLSLSLCVRSHGPTLRQTK